MSNPIFVVQEHHASTVHWDFRLEHDGTLRSWAVPKGIPELPGVRHLAIPTEDHDLGFAAFQGQIPVGHYGAGTIDIWDRGTYEKVKWSDDEIVVDLSGQRLKGRYSLVRMRDGNWLVQRVRQIGTPAGQ